MQCHVLRSGLLLLHQKCVSLLLTMYRKVDLQSSVTKLRLVRQIPNQPEGRGDATDDPRLWPRGDTGDGLERIWNGSLRPFVGGPLVVGVMLSGGCSTVSGGSGNCA